MAANYSESMIISLYHAWECKSHREPDASEPAISSSLRLKLQAGVSDFIRLTWTIDSISFLVDRVKHGGITADAVGVAAV